ncbi:MAG: hypothetical protein ABIQ95_06020 [Bdellovibrionia bacterium]
MKASLRTVFGLVLGFIGVTWGVISFATEPTSTGETGETQSACGAKTDVKSKVLSGEPTSTSTKSEERHKSSAGSAAASHSKE